MCPKSHSEVIWRGEPSSDQAGLVRAVSFCVSTPEKIPGVKMGLWQLPLLCLAFLGTWNVRQRINDSIFARSNFLGSRAHLRLSRSSSRFACQSFRGLNWHSNGWRRSDGMRKGGSRLEVAGWRVVGNSRVMVPREVPPYNASRDLSLSFCPFLSSFALWTPLRPSVLFCSYLAIWDSDWWSVFAYALYE
jgi:hypothetical protein